MDEQRRVLARGVGAGERPDVTRELLLPLELAQVARCGGSGRPPRRVWKGRAECHVCGKRFALQLSGLVRRHAEKRRFLPVVGVGIPD